MNSFEPGLERLRSLMPLLVLTPQRPPSEVLVRERFDRESFRNVGHGESEYAKAVGLRPLDEVRASSSQERRFMSGQEFGVSQEAAAKGLGDTPAAADS